MSVEHKFCVCWGLGRGRGARKQREESESYCDNPSVVDAGRCCPRVAPAPRCCRQAATSHHTFSDCLAAREHLSKVTPHPLLGRPHPRDPTASSGAGPMDTPSQTVYTRNATSGHELHTTESERGSGTGREGGGEKGPITCSLRIACDRFAVDSSSGGSRISHVLRFTTCGEDVEKRGPLCTVTGNVQCCRCCGKQIGGS